MQRENISFFVSSTFNDMHLERDTLHLEVMPRIAPLAAEKFCSIQLLDLRWGVDTSNLSEKESAERVLTVCLDGIDKCHPYMLILIGDRYGWIPPEENIADVLMEHSISAELFEKSVTELEIQYGLLMNSNTDCFIYFREIDYSKLNDRYLTVFRDSSERSRIKLEQLKAKLRERYPDRIRTYKPELDSQTGEILNTGDFADLAIKDIRSILSEIGTEEPAVWQEKEKAAIEMRLHQQENNLVQRSTQLRKLQWSLSSSPLVILTGEPGSGKTSILCQLVPALEEQYHVIPFFCGNSQTSGSTLFMLQYFVYALEETLNRNHDTGPDRSSNQTESEYWQEILTALCREWSMKHNKKVLFLIDALDQLPSNEDVSRFSWAPEGLGSTWICIASAQPDTRILREHADVQIGSLTKEEQVRIINGQFARYGKSLDGSVIQGIIGMPGSENPLYLRLVLARLLMIYRTDFEQINRDASRYGGAMESINHHLREIIASLPEKTQDLSAQILTHAVKLSSQVVKGDPETLLKSLDLIALSRYGIRLSDLEHAANLAGDSWNTLQFEWLRYFLDFCFTEQSDGRINFSHQSLRKGLLNSRNIDSPQNHELLMKTLSISQSEAAVGDSFYHMFCLGPKASSHLERMFFRIVDSMNNTLRFRWQQEMFEAADRDSGKTYLSILNEFTPQGLWYAAEMAEVFVDNRPESRQRQCMLRDISDRMVEFLETPLSLETISGYMGKNAPEYGAYLREFNNEEQFSLENYVLKAQSLFIHCTAIDLLEGQKAALPVCRQAVRAANYAYDFRTQTKDFPFVFPPLYAVYLLMSELCMNRENAREGFTVCMEGIKRIRALGRQTYSLVLDNLSAPDALLRSQAVRLMQFIDDPSLKKQMLPLMESAYYDAKLNYEHSNNSMESLNALFHTEAAYADLLDESGEHDKALDFYVLAQEHINTICSRDYGLESLMNRCSLLADLSLHLLKTGNQHAAEYAEKAEKAAQEAVLTAPEDPAPRILCAHARMIQAVILQQHSLDMQSADLCYQLLDDLEPWLDIPCKMQSTRLKCVIMDVCGNLLEKFDEPDTAALCYGYGIRFAEEIGDETSSAGMRESLRKIK